MGSFIEVLEVADRTVGIDKVIAEDKASFNQVKEYCLSKNKRLESISSRQKLNQKSFAGGELVIVASFGRIIPKEVIDHTRLILNFHPGVIQICRGRHPLPCAILARHAMMGITCHIIDNEKIDAGPIVCQINLPINYNMNYRYNENRLRGLLPGITENTLKEYRELGEVTATSWEPQPGSYFTPLPQDVLERVFKVNRLIDLFTKDII